MARRRIWAAMVLGVLLVLAGATMGVAPVAHADEADAAAAAEVATLPEAGGEEVSGRVPLAIAHDRAKLMHELYAATLEVMHQRYFHANRAVLPARALEDVFADIRRQSQVEAKWLAASLKAMNINNEPKSDFEKRAAQEIAAGRSVWEEVAGGYYRRVGSIPLGNSCVSCHAGFGREHTQTPKFAGLMISVPILDSPVTESAESPAPE